MLGLKLYKLPSKPIHASLTVVCAWACPIVPSIPGTQWKTTRMSLEHQAPNAYHYLMSVSYKEGSRIAQG